MYILQASAAGENAGFWRSVMAELTNRGVRNNLITCCDGLAGFEHAFISAIPQPLPSGGGGLTSRGTVSMITWVHG
jgi:hypothetical protein